MQNDIEDKIIKLSDEFMLKMCFLSQEVAESNGSNHDRFMSIVEKKDDHLRYLDNKYGNGTGDQGELTITSAEDYQKLIDLQKKEEFEDARLETLNDAHFIYANVLFETFLYKIFKLALQHDQIIYDRYYNHMVEIAESDAKKGDLSLIRKLGKRQKLIDELDAQGSLIQLVNKVLRVDAKNPIFQDGYIALVEIKERRNLLVHRGKHIDDVYKNTMERYLKRFQSFDKIRREIEDLDSDELMSVNPIYFQESIEALFYWSQIYKFCVLNPNTSDPSAICVASGSGMHTVMTNYLDYQGYFGLLLASSNVMSSINQYFFKEDYSKISDLDLINVLLLHNLLFHEITKFDFGENQNEVEEWIKLKRLKEFLPEKGSENFSAETCLVEFNKLCIEGIKDPNLRSMALCYLDERYEDLVRVIEEFLTENEAGFTDIKDWHLVKSLDNNNLFQSALRISNVFFLKDKTFKISYSRSVQN